MDRRSWIILIALLIAEVTSSFEGTMIYAGLKAWIAQYGDTVGPGWLVTAYLLVAAGASLLGGRLGDLYGRRKVLIGTLCLCTVGSLISALSSNLGIIVLGRAIQGVSGAIVPLCSGLAREHLPGRKVPFAISCIVATASISSAAGLIVGGMLTDRFGPHSIFIASALAAIASVLAVTASLPRSIQVRTKTPFDVLGAVLFAPSIAAMLYAIGELSRGGLASSIPVWSLTLGAIGLTVWIFHELRTAHPLIDLRLLKIPSVGLSILVLCLVALGGMQLTQIASLLVQQPVGTGAGLGLSATLFGMLKLPALVAGSLAAISTGWAITRFGLRPTLLSGAALTGLGVLPCILAPISLAGVLAFMVVTTIGGVIIYAGVSIGIVNAVPPSRTGEATGMLVVARTGSQGIGAQILMVLLGSSQIQFAESRFPDAAAFEKGLVWVALTPLVACFLLLVWRSWGRHDGSTSAPIDDILIQEPDTHRKAEA